MATNYNKCFVYSDLGGETVLVGRFRYEPETSGEFQYARSFLESGRAFPLDPQNLPLSAAPRLIASPPYVFGVLLDAGPDDWGRKVLHRLNKPVDGIAPLVLSGGSGVGALLFSLSDSATKPRLAVPELKHLEEMLMAAESVDNDQPLPPHLAELLEPGSDMGGARPKAVVRHREQIWLAKFPARHDVLDQPACEFATLSLARKLGIEVPDHELVSVADRRVLLVKRFDMARDTGHRYHYLSMAAALIVGRRLRDQDNLGSHSYMGLASYLVAHGDAPEIDCPQLFRRMVFNTLIGHVDDHSRNHGMLLRSPADRFRLSPAFDIAPSNGNAASISKPLREQALGIGQFGRARSLENLQSRSSDFLLTSAKARSVLEEIQAGLQDWKEHFIAEGVSATNIEALSHRVLACPALHPS